MESNAGDILVQDVPRGHYGSGERGSGLALQSLECAVDPKARDENQDENRDQMTPIQAPVYHIQSNPGPFQIAVLLLYCGANRNIRENGGEAPLYQEVEGKWSYPELVSVLHLTSV